jgi:hypothetical protein
MKRLDILSGGKPHNECSLPELMGSPDFMLSMKARYHGGSLVEMALGLFNVTAPGLEAAILRHASSPSSASAVPQSQPSKPVSFDRRLGQVMKRPST